MTLRLLARRSWWGRLRFRAGLLWAAFLGAPRALWALCLAQGLRRRARAELKAASPALDRLGRQLAAADAGDPLVVRYCLVTIATGEKVTLEGAPGKVALFVSHSKALQRRRTGERIQRVYVHASKLEPSVVAGRVPPRGIPLAAVLLAAVLGCGESPLGLRPRAAALEEDQVAQLPPPPTPGPVLVECTGVVVETLWVAGVPYTEILRTCPPVPPPTDTNRAEPALRSAP